MKRKTKTGHKLITQLIERMSKDNKTNQGTASDPENIDTESNDEMDMNLIKCPITNDIMYDPVIASDGHTYERKAIEKWLEEHKTSPITRQNISSYNLISNRAVKLLIDEYYKDNKDFEIDADMVYKVKSKAKPKLNTKQIVNLPHMENAFSDNIIMNTLNQIAGNINLDNYNQNQNQNNNTNVSDILEQSNFTNLIALGTNIVNQLTNNTNLINIARSLE